MISRVALVVLVASLAAGCSLGSGGSPSATGKDALGNTVFTVGGDRLANLEAKANSQCPGATRPYVHSIAGSGDNVTLTYTCE